MAYLVDKGKYQTNVIGPTTSVPAPLVTNQTVTVTGNSGDIFVPARAQSVMLYAVASGAVSGTAPTLAFALAAKDLQLTTQYYTLVTAPNITATGGTALLIVGPVVSFVANIALPAIMPAIMRVLWTVTGTTPSFGGVYATLVWQEIGVPGGA